MKSIKLLAFLVVLLLMSCGPRVQTEITTDRNLKEYNTYAFLPNSNLSAENTQYQDPVLNQAIVEAINDNLQQEGYKLDQDNPELLVLVSTKFKEMRRTSVRPRYSYYPYRFGGTRYTPNVQSILLLWIYGFWPFCRL